MNDSLVNSLWCIAQGGLFWGKIYGLEPVSSYSWWLVFVPTLIMPLLAFVDVVIFGN